MEDLILDHCDTIGCLPCLLQLPEALQSAQNKGELRALAILEEEFWKSHHSRVHQRKFSSKSASVSSPPPQSVQVQEDSVYKAPPFSQTSYVFTAPNSSSKDVLIDFEGNHDQILKLYENISSGWKRHSWSSEQRPSVTTGTTRKLSSGAIPGSSNSSSFVFQHKRSSSDCTRQFMRYSSPKDVDPFLSTCIRYPPPSCAPPPPPVEDRLSLSIFPGESQHGDPTGNKVHPMVSPYSKGRTLSSVGASLESRSSTSDESVGSLGRSSLISFSSRASQLSSASFDPSESSSSLQTDFNLDIHSSDIYNVPLQTYPARGADCQNVLGYVPTSPSRSASVDLSEFDPLSKSKFDLTSRSTFDFVFKSKHGPISKSEDDLMRTFDNANPYNAPVSAASENSSSSRSSCDDSHLRGKLPFDYRGSCSVETSPQHMKAPISEIEKSHSLPSTLKRGMSLPAKESFEIIEVESLLEHKLVLKSSSDMSGTGESDLEASEEGVNVYSENRNTNRSEENIRMSQDLTKTTSSPERKKKHGTHRISSKIKRIAKRKSKQEKKRKPLRLSDPAAAIQDVLTRLSKDPNERFAILLERFYESQRDLCEVHKPDIILMKVRQFMNGLKNYLFNGMEKEVDFVIDKFSELTNSAALDAIFEGALHQFVLEPLRDHIYMCFIQHFKSTGAIALLDSNIRSAKEKTPEELGIRKSFLPPKKESMAHIKGLFGQMQYEASPLKKLEILLQIVKAIYSTVEDTHDGRETVASMGADDFLPMLIYVVVQCDLVQVEIEVEYMWGLLDPSMLSGEGGYYLTTLSSAICVLKQFEKESELETKGFLTIFVACGDQYKDIKIKSIPVLPRMTAVDVCNIVVNKLNLDSQRPHQLFILSGGKEIPLKQHHSIVKEKTEHENLHGGSCRFGLRPEDMKIEWPALTFTEFADI